MWIRNVGHYFSGQNGAFCGIVRLELGIHMRSGSCAKSMHLRRGRSSCTCACPLTTFLIMMNTYIYMYVCHENRSFIQSLTRQPIHFKSNHLPTEVNRSGHALVTVSLYRLQGVIVHTEHSILDGKRGPVYQGVLFF